MAGYQQGQIVDVPVLTRLHERAAAAHASYQVMRDLFEDLERIAGVEHRRGRSFYGLRRQATDLAPEFAQDARVLNSISGHADSATREQVYQDKENERVRVKPRRYGAPCGATCWRERTASRSPPDQTYPTICTTPPGRWKSRGRCGRRRGS